jgi:hypothetical protein
MSTAPLVSVLDNINISSRCSACFIAEDDLAPGKLLSQCSLCQSLRYCSAVRCSPHTEGTALIHTPAEMSTTRLGSSQERVQVAHHVPQCGQG